MKSKIQEWVSWNLEETLTLYTGFWLDSVNWSSHCPLPESLLSPHLSHPVRQRQTLHATCWCSLVAATSKKSTSSPYTDNWCIQRLLQFNSLPFGIEIVCKLWPNSAKSSYSVWKPRCPWVRPAHVGHLFTKAQAPLISIFSVCRFTLHFNRRDESDH